ncbi:MAG: DUF3429 domain-containing protein [Parvularculaceae bacterium]|nr:DUF3429 domain-containing protein [Parvularculaceae bacterium]
MTYADVLELNRRQPRRNAFAADERRPAEAGKTTPMTGAASFLAYLGAAPLLAAALAMVANPADAGAEAFITLYGATLLVFFGGVRWGVAVMKPTGPTMRALLGAALPMLAALPLFAPGDPQTKMLAIMALMIVLLFDDLQATRRGDGAPAWYLGVRMPLTVLIEVALLVALTAA